MKIERYEKEILPIIKDAGKNIIRKFSKQHAIREKGYANYVTELDKEVEEFVISEISAIYPGSIFVSEENSQRELRDSYWVLDPIDGTTNLIHKYQSVCISLAYVQGGSVEFGVVYSPFSDEMFYACRGAGAYLCKQGEKQRISVNNSKELKGSLVGFGCPYNKSRIPYIFSIIEKILTKCDDVKRMGPASLDICYVACGRLAAYVELDLEIWDFLAGSLILEEAGGSIYNFSGTPISIEKTDIIVTNSKISKEILEITADQK